MASDQYLPIIRDDIAARLSLASTSHGNLLPAYDASSRPQSHVHVSDSSNDTNRTGSGESSGNPPSYTPAGIPPRTSSLISPTPSIVPLSSLIKRRRRRCGGVFRPLPTNDADDQPKYEYDLPHTAAQPNGSNSQGPRGRAWGVPDLRIDATAANEAFRDGRLKPVEPLTPIREMFPERKEEPKFDLNYGSMGLKYDFERDVERVGSTTLVGGNEGAIVNRRGSADSFGSENKAARSVSNHSQWSLESDQSGFKVVQKTGEVAQSARQVSQAEKSLGSILVEDDAKRRIREANEQWERLKQRRTKTGKGDDKSIRSRLSRVSKIGKINKVAGGVRNKTRSFVDRAEAKLSSLRLPKRRGQSDACQGQGAQVGEEVVDAQTPHSPVQLRFPKIDRLGARIWGVGVGRGG
jgi:hypothetical protein